MVMRILCLAAIGLAAVQIGCSSISPARVETVSFETREATRIAFDVSPDGRDIVMDLLGQLWRVPIEGGEAVPITDAVRDTAEDIDPVISPDGRRIVFQSDRPGGRALWIMSAGGGPAARLTTRDIGYFAYVAPAWAPDGQRVAYAVGEALAVLNVDTGAEEVLHIDSLPPGPPAWLMTMTPRHASPAWSPDGTRIAFIDVQPNNLRGVGRIWEAPAEGGMARPLTTMPGLAPAWSPDGSRLVFLARDSANRWQVWVQPAGGTAERLTNHDEMITSRVRWVPDGRSLVYAADGGLWRVAADGGEPEPIPFRARVTMTRRHARLRPITFARPGTERTARGVAAVALAADGRRVAMIALDSLWIGEPGSPFRRLGPASGAGDDALAWSPDGSGIAWTAREGPGRPLNLQVSNARTGETRVLVSIGQDVIWPLWSPDGRWIAFLAGDRLRVVESAATRVDSPDQLRDLGAAAPAWGTMAWTPRSDALVIALMNPSWRQNAMLVPLDGAPRAIPQFPRGAANLGLRDDGRAVWVAENRLWEAPWNVATGLLTPPSALSDDAALEARHAKDGTVLYLSPAGLRLRAPGGRARTLGWPLRYRTPAAPEPTLIRGVRIIDGRGNPLSASSDVLLKGGRIARIAPAGTVAASGVRIVDGNGAFLVPGLIELHAHLWDDLSLAAWLHTGVTTIRDVASQKLKTADTRNAVEAGILDGPRIVYGGAMFHGGDSGYTTLADQMSSDPGALARAVAILAGLDAGFVKWRAFDDWWSGVHLVTEAHRFGMVVSGHCGHILPVAAAGLNGAEHVLDCSRDRYTMRSDYAELARSTGLWVVPTGAALYSMLRAWEDPALATEPDVAPFVTPSDRERYWGADSPGRRNSFRTSLQRVERGIRRYHDAGVTIATGTDSPVPVAIHHEMEVLVASGLTPMEAIVAATGAAARVLNAPEIGVIAEGRWADLVLLSANPLDDIRNTRHIRAVIQGGRLIDRDALQRRGVR